jgi:ABC-type glycerol-3-phosphate transport system substrate-binding protein
MRLQRFLPLFAALLAVSALANPDLPTKTNAKRDLVIWGIQFGPDSKGAEAVVKEFERRNPDINVRVLSMGAGTMNPQKLMTSIVGNVAPDVINQDRFSISDWASRGAFMSLSPLIERDRKTDPLTPTPEQYYKAPWDEATYEGQVYGIPTGADNRILYHGGQQGRNAEASRLPSELRQRMALHLRLSEQRRVYGCGAA